MPRSFAPSVRRVRALSRKSCFRRVRIMSRVCAVARRRRVGARRFVGFRRGARRVGRLLETGPALAFGEVGARGRAAAAAPRARPSARRQARREASGPSQARRDAQSRSAAVRGDLDRQSAAFPSIITMASSSARWSRPACPAIRRPRASSPSSAASACIIPTSIPARPCPSCSASPGRASPCISASCRAIRPRTAAFACRPASPPSSGG